MNDLLHLVLLITNMWPGIQVVEFKCDINMIDRFFNRDVQIHFYQLNVDAIDILQCDTFVIKGKCKPEVYEYLSNEYVKTLL